MTTTQKINLMREVRLTFVQVVIPIGVGFVYLDRYYPSWKYNTKKSFKRGKTYIVDKVQSFKKGLKDE